MQVIGPIAGMTATTEEKLPQPAKKKKRTRAEDADANQLPAAKRRRFHKGIQL